jgi:hypothetical protein
MPAHLTLDLSKHVGNICWVQNFSDALSSAALRSFDHHRAANASHTFSGLLGGLHVGLRVEFRRNASLLIIDSQIVAVPSDNRDA